MTITGADNQIYFLTIWRLKYFRSSLTRQRKLFKTQISGLFKEMAKRFQFSAYKSTGIHKYNYILPLQDLAWDPKNSLSVMLNLILILCLNVRGFGKASSGNAK